MDSGELAAETVLSRQQARVALLAAEGLEPPAIADEMGLTRQAVHSHLDRARAKAAKAQATTEYLAEIGFTN